MPKFYGYMLPNLSLIAITYTKYRVFTITM